jgi:hypothetical protein
MHSSNHTNSECQIREFLSLVIAGSYIVLPVLFQSDCAKIRRQKELELEVLSGSIREWEGEAIASLGDVLHLGAVAVVAGAGAERKERVCQIVNFCTEFTKKIAKKIQKMILGKE